MTSSRVIPARQPADSGGVVTTPSNTQKTFVPVPSHRLPTVLAKIASEASRCSAYASARTFSPYDVVLSPASAPRSLRVHGTVTTAVRRLAGAISLVITTSDGMAAGSRPE